MFSDGVHLPGFIQCRKEILLKDDDMLQRRHTPSPSRGANLHTKHSVCSPRACCMLHRAWGKTTNVDMLLVLRSSVSCKDPDKQIKSA